MIGASINLVRVDSIDDEPFAQDDARSEIVLMVGHGERRKQTRG